GEYYNFCLEHGKQYNKNYNYFAGMAEDELKAWLERNVTGHRPTWRMGANAWAFRPGGRRPRSGGFRHNRPWDDHFGLFGEETDEPRRPRRTLPPLQREALQRLGLDVAFRYRKWTDPTAFEEVRWSAPLEVVVVSFFDWLSHIWSRHPYFRGLDFQRFVRFLMEETRLKGAIQGALQAGYTVFLSSDHGWVEASQPVVIRAGQEVKGGLRFKWGDSLRVIRGKAIEVRDLDAWGLPRHWGGRLLMAQEDGFFVYETDPSRFRQTYAGWMFHGGVSLQEMVVPMVRIRALEEDEA
ncbi:MAG: hypothetical protein L3J76_01590, partial [Candidatus Hydrothermae bacterium]|nr:hypothetical protein [Candidatus Hydrothermae bacterium]